MLSKHGVPGRLAGVHGGEAVLDEGARVREFDLLFGRKILRRKFGVRHQHSLEPHFLAASHQRENLVPAQMSGGQNHVMPADAVPGSGASLRSLCRLRPAP